MRKFKNKGKERIFLQGEDVCLQPFKGFFSQLSAGGGKFLTIILFIGGFFVLNASVFSSSLPTGTPPSEMISPSPSSFLSAKENMTSHWWEGMSYKEIAEYLETLSPSQAAQKFKQLAEYSITDAAYVLKEMNTQKAASMLLAEDTSHNFIISLSLRVNVVYKLIKISSFKGGDLLEEIIVNKDTQEGIAMIKNKPQLMTKISLYKARKILKELSDDGKENSAAEIIKVLSPTKAANILRTLEPSDIAKIIMAKDSNNNYVILRERRSEILYKLVKITPTKGADALKVILTGTNAEEGTQMVKEKPQLISHLLPIKIGEILKSINVIYASEIVKALSPTKAANILRTLDPSDIARIIMAKDNNNNYVILRERRSQILYRLVRITPTKGGNTLKVILTGTNAEEGTQMVKEKPQLISRLSPFKGGEILGSINTTYAAEIVDALSPRRAAERLRRLSPSTITDILMKQVDNEYILTIEERNAIVKKLIKLSPTTAKNVLIKILKKNKSEGIKMIKQDTRLLIRLPGFIAADVLTSTNLSNKEQAEILNAIGPTQRCYNIMVGFSNENVKNILLATENAQWMLPRLFRINMLIRFHRGMQYWRAGEILKLMWEENNDAKAEVKQMILEKSSIIMFLGDKIIDAMDTVAEIFHSFTEIKDRATVIDGLQETADASKLLNAFLKNYNTSDDIKSVGKVLNWISVGREDILLLEEDFSEKAREILVGLDKDYISNLIAEFITQDMGIVVARNFIKQEEKSVRIARVLNKLMESTPTSNFKDFLITLSDPNKNKKIALGKFSSIMRVKGEFTKSYLLKLNISATLLENTCISYEDEESSISDNLTFFFNELEDKRMAEILEKTIENNSSFVAYSASAFKNMVEDKHIDRIVNLLEAFSSKFLPAEILTVKNEKGEYSLSLADLLKIFDGMELDSTLDLIDEIFAVDNNRGGELSFYFEKVELIESYIEKAAFSSIADEINQIYTDYGLNTATTILGLLSSESSAVTLLSLQIYDDGKNDYGDLAEDLIYNLDDLTLLDKKWGDIAKIVEAMDDVTSSPEYFNGKNPVSDQNMDGHTYAAYILKNIMDDEDKKEDVIDLFKVITTEDGGKIINNIHALATSIDDMDAGFILFGIVELDNDTESDEIQAAGLLTHMETKNGKLTQAVNFVKNINPSPTTSEEQEKLNEIVSIFAHTSRARKNGEEKDRAAEILKGVYDEDTTNNVELVRTILLNTTDYDSNRSASLLVSIYKLPDNGISTGPAAAVDIIDDITSGTEEFDKLVKLFSKIDETDENNKKINYGGEILFKVYGISHAKDLIRNLILDENMDTQQAEELMMSMGKTPAPIGQPSGQERVADVFGNYTYNLQSKKFKKLVEIFEITHPENAAVVLETMYDETHPDNQSSNNVESIIDRIIQHKKYKIAGDIFANKKIQSITVAYILNANVDTNQEITIDNYSEALKRTIATKARGSSETKLYNIDFHLLNLDFEKAIALENKLLEKWGGNLLFLHDFDYDNDGDFDSDDIDALDEDLNGDGNVDQKDKDYLLDMFIYPYLPNSKITTLRNNLLPTFVKILNDVINSWTE